VLLPALLVLGAVLLAVSVTPAPASSARTCNGAALLCDRRYDQVAYVATHNAMAAADHPNWVFAEQPTSLVGQLDGGARALLFDVWMGQPTSRPPLVRTVDSELDDALAQARATWGAAEVDSALRQEGALQVAPSGPAAPYLCHNLCELGATPFGQAMVDVREWLQRHPTEVVTFFVQDEGVTPAQTAHVLDAAGLLPYVVAQRWGQPWPTLGEMVASGHRLVVLMENHGGGTAYPYLLQAFQWVQDTPYEYQSAAQFSCARLRGEADSPLFLVNHWLSNAATREQDAAAVNTAVVLGRRVRQCQAERGRLPNFVAVDFYDLGDVAQVVDELNG
jgi:hypothetical protein